MSPDYFVIYKPRDIVSGDFYWVKVVKNHLIVVSADCTGHGVPGAFMSMLGITLLNEHIDESALDNPGEILNLLRKKVKDIMYTPAEGEYVSEHAMLDTAIHQLVVGHHHSLLVTRGEEIVGVLRLTDVFREVCLRIKECMV